MRNQMHALERREKQLYATNKEGQVKEEDLRRKLSTAEGELKAATKRATDAEAKMKTLREEKQIVLTGHTVSSEAQSVAFQALKEQSAKQAKELNDTKEQLAAARQTAENASRELRSKTSEYTVELTQLRQQLADSKCKAQYLDFWS